MSDFPQLFCVVIAAVLLSAFSTQGSPEALNGEVKAPVCPAKIPADWLSPAAHPRLLCNGPELARARETVRRTDWGKAYLAEQRSICAPFLPMDEETLRSLVPKPGSLFVYGAGMNLDPVHGKRMIWCGWERPFSVKDAEGRVYPNDEWKDDGTGSPDSKTGERFYFVAQGNAAIMQHLEQKVLPALADLYALDGNQVAAKNAAILLDAISAVYASNKRGPIDYPLDYPGDEVRGGRLDRPYYQTARGLVNYANTVDLIAPSGEFEKASPLGHTIRENVIRDLLWNGGAFCWEYAVSDFQLYNGHADYLRGAAVTGILLGRRDFCDPLLTGSSGIHAMLDNNLGRDGLYYETSPLYAEHTRDLFVTIAEMVEAGRNLGWKDCGSIYSDPAMRLFLKDTFDRQEVGGHIPVLGDDGPDLFVNDPMRRLPTKDFALSDNYINGQIDGAWVRLVRSPDPADRHDAAELLADTYAAKRPVVPPSTRWSIYHIGMDAVAAVEAQTPNPADFETRSAFLGAKGLAILRGGEGSKRYGAQLFFGPLHNHGQFEALTWSFFAKGAEWSNDPGYFTSHFRFGWTQHTVAHQAVTVDASSIDPDHGSGYLVSWLSTPEVQWAMADHPGAYREHGVTVYERLIGQVMNPATGEIGYWLDVSRVKGGKMRDDSFHTQMRNAKLSVELPTPADGSLVGPIDFGRIIRNDCRLKGYDDKGFYWQPDGDGYGFLGRPRKAAMPSSLRVVMTDPAYASKIKTSIVADMLGSPNEELIVADGPDTVNSTSVPYVLRRDTGIGTSVFAKIVRLVDDSSTDHIRSFEEVPVQNADEGKSWCVTWTTGRRDLWIAAETGHSVRVLKDGLPTVVTDARVALISFDPSGELESVRASEASSVAVGRKQIVSGIPSSKGRVKGVSVRDSHVVLNVDWAERASISAGSPVITIPPIGQPSTWELKSAGEKMIELADVKSAMASTGFKPIAGKPGWYQMTTAVSRFYSASGRSNKAYAVGKTVCDGRGYVGRILEIAPDAHSVKIQSDGKLLVRGAFSGKIMEVGIGDRFVIPSTLCWTKK